jgi:hypothetical protein
MDKILSSLGHRIFLMHNVHEDQPVLFQTRWALSYLRGPLTRQQIQVLMGPRKEKLKKEKMEFASKSQLLDSTNTIGIKPEESGPPAVPSSISQFYLPCEVSIGKDESLIYRAALLGVGRLHYVSVRAKIDHWKTLSLISPFKGNDMNIPWEEATTFEGETPALGN